MKKQEQLRKKIASESTFIRLTSWRKPIKQHNNMKERKKYKLRSVINKLKTVNKMDTPNIVKMR